ncbi:MAG TPA: hypothetical protein VKA68_06340 [bacterium]|nr:hypothetical protein [bacterium]
MPQQFIDIEISNQTLQYRYNPEADQFEFRLPQGTAVFEVWDWGTKNATLEECMFYDQPSDEFSFDSIRFNEHLLLCTLRQLRIHGENLPIDLSTLRDLNASLGDLLLEISQRLLGLNGTRLGNGYYPEISRDMENPDSPVITAGDHTYTFRMWTWGEKNRALSQALTMDEPGNQARVSTKIFHERMLLSSLAKVTDENAPVEISTDFLEQLDARIGDALLEVAQEINFVSDAEKKS